MKYKKIMFMLVLAIFIFGAASVCASDVNDTVIASDDDSSVELSQADTGKMMSSEEDELISEGNSGTFAELQANITQATNGSTLTLNKNYECEDGFDSEGIVIDKSLTIDGNGFKIDAQGKSRIFNVTAENVILKNIIFTNGKTTGKGGAVYFLSNGAVINCNFTLNTATDGGAIYYSDGTTGEAINCNFKDNLATSSGGALVFLGNGTVTDCNFIENTGKSGSGGAVYLITGTVTNCNFDNSTAKYGGAVYLGAGTVTNCNFINNSAHYGGAVEFDGTGTVTNCNFAGNKATGEYSYGGAVFFSASGEVRNCNFTDNTATYYGGAVYFLDQGTVSNCNFTDNKAYYGGAVYFENSGNVSNCNFTNNTASGDGGAIRMYSGTVTNCNFVNNSATGQNCWGGTIRMSSGTVTNCNFAGNKATGEYSYGGAVYFSRNGEVTNCNFVNNSATYEGGAVWIYSGTVTNCNFVDNSANRGGAIFSNTEYTTADTCIFKRNSGENVNVVIYPPTLNVDNFTTVYGSGEKLTFDLKTNSSIPVTNGNISISVYFKDNDSWVGNYSCLSGEGWTVDLLPGSYYAIFDTEFASFQPVNITIIVKKADSPVEMSIVLDYGASTNVIMAFEGAIGIIAKIDGHNVSVDNFTIPIAGLNAGTHYLKVTSIPDVNHNPVTKNVTIEVNRIQTVLAGNAVTATYNVNKDLVITLKDANGNPVSGASVTVDLNGAKTFITDKNGQIMVSTNGLDPKAYTVKVTFNGNNNYVQSSKSIKVTVKKANPKLTAKKQTFKKSVKIKKYSIVLKNNLGKAIKNAKVFIKVGKKTFKAKTNSKGKAVFKIKKLTKKGTYKAKVTFKGDKHYNKATKKVKITIK